MTEELKAAAQAAGSKSPGAEPAAQPAGRYKSHLSRSLSFRENILITLSSVTPASSVFIIAPAVIQGLGGGSVLAFVIGALIGITVALSYAELSSAFPVTGGEYSFVARALGKIPGFMLFVQTLISGVFIVAVVASGAGTYLGVLLPGVDSTAIGVAVILITTLIGCFSIRANAWVTGIFLVLELAALLVLSLLGFTHITQPISTMWTVTALGSDGFLVPATAGMVISFTSTALLAYNGYGTAVYFAEETKGASKTIGRAIMWSLVVAVISELVPIIAVVLGTPSMKELMGAKDPMSYFLEVRGGALLESVVSIGVAIAIINAVLAILLQNARVLYASARDGSWPGAIGKPLSSVSHKTQTPVVATIVTGVIAALILGLVPFDVLLVVAGAGILITYAFVALAALIGRINGKTRHAPYKMPLWPAVPIIMLLATLAVAYENLVTDWIPVAVAIMIAVVGLPYYFFYLHKRRDRWTLPQISEEDSLEEHPEPVQDQSTAANPWSHSLGGER